MIDPNRIAIDWKTLIDFKRETMPARRCWTTCGICKRNWAETKTENVHMAINHKGETKFFCTQCLDKQLENASNN